MVLLEVMDGRYVIGLPSKFKCDWVDSKFGYDIRQVAGCAVFFVVGTIKE